MQYKSIWLQVLVGRTCVFLFLLSIIVAGLFFLGNLQEFLDSTQILLLNMLNVTTLVFLSFAVFFLTILIVEGARRRKLHPVKIVLTIIGIILIAFIFFMSNFLSSWLTEVR